MTKLASSLVAILSTCCLLQACHGWHSTQNRGRRKPDGSSTGRLPSTRPNSGDDVEKKRMEMVRSLQGTFYQSAAMEKCSLDLSIGIIKNLPLWRVQWVELPGRTNCLNVFDPIYTNMYESILRSGAPWYVGHLYLPEGSRNLGSEDPFHKLRAWRTELPSAAGRDQAHVLGTLLRITDFRRMADGRLLLLVQALERFVIVDVVQDLPYGKADVQLIPDIEEIEDSEWFMSYQEEQVKQARALALQESWLLWHRYEFENTMLKVPYTEELQPEDIRGSFLTEVLPFAAFSPVVDPKSLERKRVATLEQNTVERTNATSLASTFEGELIACEVLKHPPAPASLLQLTVATLEIRLWLILSQLVKANQLALSPHILGLLPPDHSWPSDFVLEKLAEEASRTNQLGDTFVRVPKAYPALRRQKRMSYHAGALLERGEDRRGLRQKLLASPSTRERLAMIVHELEMLQIAFN